MLLCAIGTTNKVRRHAGYIIHDWLTFAALALRRSMSSVCALCTFSGVRFWYILYTALRVLTNFVQPYISKTSSSQKLFQGNRSIFFCRNMYQFLRGFSAQVRSALHGKFSCRIRCTPCSFVPRCYLAVFLGDQVYTSDE